MIKQSPRAHTCAPPVFGTCAQAIGREGSTTAKNDAIFNAGVTHGPDKPAAAAASAKHGASN